MEDKSEQNVFTLMPQQPNEKKPGQLPLEKVKEFFREGFLVVEDFLNIDDLQACRDAISGQVDNLATKLFKAGKIKETYSEYGFFERLSKIENDFPGSNILLHKEGIMHPAFQKIWSDEKLLNVVEQIVGPDIAGHPVWNLRTKTPNSAAVTVPWHQDCGYLSDLSYSVMQLTAWIPLLDANLENGCMQVVRRGHTTGKIATHQCCAGPTWYVMLEEDEMEKTLDVDMSKDVVTCPIKFGSMLLLQNAIPHRSLNNASDKIRWSLDLRWQKPSEPNGFYGLKESILMRTSSDPNYKINWDEWNIDRHKLQEEAAGKSSTGWHSKADDNEFDTTISGPWMNKWEIVHENRHTAALKRDDAETWTKA